MQPQKMWTSLMHNETSGSASDYTANGWHRHFNYMNLYGFILSGIRVYVGRIIHEWTSRRSVDGRSLPAGHKKRAEHHICLDVSWTVRSTGLQRTWPHWMASKQAGEMKYNAFSTCSSAGTENLLAFHETHGGPWLYTRYFQNERI